MLPALALSLALTWVQVQSDTFVVKSSVGEEKARRVLRELESFHQLIGTTLVFQKVELPELPIEVLLIGDEQLFQELSPEFGGKKVKVSGYYQRGQDRDFIVLSSEVAGNLTRVVYHELTHYFLSRTLRIRPTWLSEGLAEYFATVDIDETDAYLGGLSDQRLTTLKEGRIIPLRDFFAVDDQSPYYNENFKANLFYSQAWAFTHFLMHGPYRAEFTRFLHDLTNKEVKFTDYVKTDLRTLQTEFESYLAIRMRLATRERVKTNPERWTMQTKPITDAEIELAITEIYLAAGKLDDARRHLEKVAGIDEEFPRASYYRGVLARISREGSPNELFIDALMDLNLGPRAAVHLVQLNELSIPAARRALEQAAASGTHMNDVYWALSEIYLNDARRIEETVHLLNRPAAVSVPVSRAPAGESAPETPRVRYATGSGNHFSYDLSSESGEGPRVLDAMPPVFPPELLAQRLRGEVVMDVQVTEVGTVGALWLISASPEIFDALATTAVREWKFDPSTAKIRVTLRFEP